MAETRRYLLTNFTRSYLLIFAPFFLIVSLIYLVQISVLSSKVSLSTLELARLFAYFLPEILFFTVPLSLIAALANTVARLSEDNELIALFALGHRPETLLRSLLPVTLLFSLLLLTVSLLIFPQMQQRLARFKARKIAEATLNIQPNKLSQRFGEYHVFVEGKKGKRYKHAVLFHKRKEGGYRLFLSDTATVENNHSVFTLTLANGSAESSRPDKLQVLRYDRLKIFQYPQSRFVHAEPTLEYWQKARTDSRRRGRMLYFLLVALSPLLIFVPVVAYSLYNPRYQRNLSMPVIFVAALALYLPAALVQRSGSLWIFLGAVLFFLLFELGAWRRLRNAY